MKKGQQTTQIKRQWDSKEVLKIYEKYVPVPSSISPRESEDQTEFIQNLHNESTTSDSDTDTHLSENGDIDLNEILKGSLINSEDTKEPASLDDFKIIRLIG